MNGKVKTGQSIHLKRLAYKNDGIGCGGGERERWVQKRTVMDAADVYLPSWVNVT
jgi:hypothetical protein